ncbi:MAG: AraC family transcriptional regulator [Verrucomicrobiota bacterium]
MVERQVVNLQTHGIPEVPELGRYQYRRAQRGLKVHAHPGTLEICYLATGKQLYRVGRSDYVLTGGDVFVTFPDEIHSTGESPEEKGTLYWLQVFLPRRPRSFLNCDQRECWALVDQLRRLPNRHFAGEPILARLLDDALAASAGDPLQRIRIQNRLVDFLLRVIDLARQRPRPSVSPAISELLRYIETNVHQTLPLPALAARLKLSLPRFKARFKHEVGLPPAEYVLRCKVEAAKRQLSLPGATVTDVALALNFSSSQYFATVFRRYTGRTPSTHRAAMPSR